MKKKIVFLLAFALLTFPLTACGNTEPDMTADQKNALKSAENCLATTSFSHSSLIEQLESEGYSTEDATFAVDNCGADWNEQAEKKAAEYLAITPFERDELVEQLEYEGFTTEQAEHGVSVSYK